MEFDEEYDALKTKVLKYVLYKKRTEQEVKLKFKKNSGKILDDVIEYLKQENYINDIRYIEKSIKEFMALRNLSIKEIQYKISSKGIEYNLLQDYIYINKEELLEYELQSAVKIVYKKQSTMEKEEIIEYLRKKGYIEANIQQAIKGEE